MKRKRGGRRKLGPSGRPEPDRISALPEDLLLHVLLRLRCARAAARTAVLSRPWRGLWTRLPDLLFRDVALRHIRSALSSIEPAAAGVTLTLLDILIPEAPVNLIYPLEMALNGSVSAVLRAAAALSPVHLRLAFGLWRPRVYIEVDVPRFPRAESLDLEGLDLVFAEPRGGWLGFPALERLSLTSCRANLTDLVLRCPRLRVFRLREEHGSHHMNIIVKSSSLQELDVETRIPFTYRVDIRAPVLKRLAMSFSTSNRIVVWVSVLAPMLEKVSWRCNYSTVSAGLGLWGLLSVRLQTVETNGQLPPHVHALSLFVTTHSSYTLPEHSLGTEIEKHMVTHFSVLELHVKTLGHVYGAFALHVLGMDRICNATQSLKVILLRSSKDNEACPENCPCDVPNDWRSQTISLTSLEEVEIKGLKGEDHEFDFLKLVFRCAPMLKTVSVWLSDQVTGSNDCCKKIHDIFKVYPLLECSIVRPESADSSHSGAPT